MQVTSDRLRALARASDGFTMIIALGVMLVTGLLIVAAFAAAQGDIRLSGNDLQQKQAYYAALAGVQEYEYQLQSNPNYWETCPKPASTTTLQESGVRYEVNPLPANKTVACSEANPFETMIEATGPQANTFRVESTGYAGKDKRAIVATFKVNGFLNYVYFTRYEDEDPQLSGQPVSECKRYHEEKGKPQRSASCGVIEFAPGDNVNGPMHTDDAALACGEVEFGRKGNVPPDPVEINGGPYETGCGGATGHPIYNSPTKGPEVGTELIPPESDTSLAAYVESGYEFEGATTLVLEGKFVSVTNANYNGGVTKQIELPKNGLIFVRASKSAICKYVYQQEPADTAALIKEEAPCGTIYVKGNYSKSLTLAGENEVVVKGNIVPTGVTPPAKPAGTITLGLIASGFVRVYHACGGGGSEEGLTNPWIYAAILSTAHSFAVDNFGCGSSLGELNVFGAIAQNFRGIVGRVGGSGYLKEYQYDNRLATDEPPYFLAPLKAGWKVARETAPTGG